MADKVRPGPTPEEIRQGYLEGGRKFFQVIQTEAEAWDYLRPLMAQISQVFQAIAARDGIRVQEAGAYSFATCSMATIISTLRERCVDGLVSDDIREQLLANFEKEIRSRPLVESKRRSEQ